MSLIVSKMDGFIGTLTVNRPEKFNALSNLLTEGIIAALDFFEQKEARVVVLRMVVTKGIWSAGHDITELPEKGKDPLDPKDSLRRLIAKMQSVSYPIIAMIDGDVYGGANEVVAVCDHAIASCCVRFRFTPARMGVPYDAVGLQNMINAIGLRATKEMVFTADYRDADWAEKRGLINEAVLSVHLESKTYEWAEMIAKNAPLAIHSMKYTLNALAEKQPLSFPAKCHIEFLRREAYSSDDYENAKLAVMSKPRREPVFKGE
jgi:methylmalonyl-CoA decarboxylase